MKILLFGKNGQIGWELQRSLAPLADVVALDRRSNPLCGDLADLDGIAQTVLTVMPDVIVNAAAYTAVDRAESEPEAAHVINTLAPGVLARQAARAGAWLVHYSTDYVFDGTGEISWQETDLPDPRSVYGRTKLHGEEAIRASGCRHLIFRTSWVYATRGHNFAKTMLRLAQERDVLTVVDDQVGAPTGADLIADVTAHSIRMAMRQPDVSGLYHLAASGQTSWYEYARLVLEQARQSRPAQVDAIKVAPDAIHPIPSDAFPVPAERPKNSRLDTRKLTATFDLQLPAWQGGVKRMLAEILNDQRFEI